MVGDVAGDMAGKVLLKRGAPEKRCFIAGEYTLRQPQPMEDPYQSRDNPERPAAH